MWMREKRWEKAHVDFFEVNNAFLKKKNKFHRFKFEILFLSKYRRLKTMMKLDRLVALLVSNTSLYV
jgi:hypothetical protein